MPEYAGIYRPNDRPNRHTNRPKLEAAESVRSGTTPLLGENLIGPAVVALLTYSTTSPFPTLSDG